MPGYLRGVVSVQDRAGTGAGGPGAAGAAVPEAGASLVRGEACPELERLVEHRYECLLDGDKEGFRDSREIFAHALDRLLSSPLAADGLVLDAMDRNNSTEIPAALEPYLDRRQLAILRVVQNRDMEAVRLLPEAYCYLMAGIAGYEQGSDYVGGHDPAAAGL